jgi:hypothetical protein
MLILIIRGSDLIIFYIFTPIYLYIYRYFMATTFINTEDGENLRDFRLLLGHRINLFKPPYCIRDPIRLYQVRVTHILVVGCILLSLFNYKNTDNCYCNYVCCILGCKPCL